MLDTGAELIYLLMPEGILRVVKYEPGLSADCFNCQHCPVKRRLAHQLDQVSLIFHSIFVYAFEQN